MKMPLAFEAPARGGPRTRAEAAIIDYLRLLTDIADRNAERAVAHRTRPTNPHRMVPMLLRQGSFFDPPRTARVRGVAKMPDQQCFKNAAKLAMQEQWLYAEGFASSGHPIHHAWCVNAQGRVVDPTWESPGAAYYGLAMRATELARHLSATGRYGIFDGS